MVLDSISKLQDVNFIPKVVICDQDTCHRSLFAKFHISCLSPSITVNNEQIFFMYDTPHLMKSIRNNFMKYNFSSNDSVAKWDYIKAFYNMDQQMSIRLTPKLTEKHIYCNTVDKMRVKLATQVLSRTVAAAIATYAKLRALPKEAIATAEFVENFDLLFDLFNSGQKFHYKPTKCAFTTSSLSYLTELQTFINSLQVIGTERSLPCVEGWKLNIACLKSLWQNLHDQYDYQFLLTNRLNQDSLENLFSCIRNSGGNSDSPTAPKFVSHLKNVVTNSFMNDYTYGNCLHDETPFLSLFDFERSTGSQQDEVSHCETDVDTNLVVDDECNEYQKESVKSGDSTLASYFASFNPFDIDNQNETPVPFPHVSTTAMPDPIHSLLKILTMAVASFMIFL